MGRRKYTKIRKVLESEIWWTNSKVEVDRLFDGKSWCNLAEKEIGRSNKEVQIIQNRFGVKKWEYSEEHSYR